jgi:hypothetical protein
MHTEAANSPHQLIPNVVNLASLAETYLPLTDADKVAYKRFAQRWLRQFVVTRVIPDGNFNDKPTPDVIAVKAMWGESQYHFDWFLNRTAAGIRLTGLNDALDRRGNRFYSTMAGALAELEEAFEDMRDQWVAENELPE